MTFNKQTGLNHWDWLTFPWSNHRCWDTISSHRYRTCYRKTDGSLYFNVGKPQAMLLLRSFFEVEVMIIPKFRF